MNYYQAREMYKDGKPSGKWHYICMNDGKIWPVGYCSPWKTCLDCDGKSAWYHLYDDTPDCATCNNKGIVEDANPCPGHDTPDEAVTTIESIF